MLTNLLKKVKKLIFIIYSILFIKKNYNIKRGYRSRLEIKHFNDTGTRDEWQKEVYEYANKLFIKHGFNTCLDIGCGSGYKLINYFEKFEFTGVEIEPTLSFLRKTYPSSKWETLDNVYGKTFDMVILADVIEHIEDPTTFLNRILVNIKSKIIIISTPDRDILHSKFHFGPPINHCHYREWNFNEFEEYIENFIYISEHFISNRGQATQLLVGKSKFS